MESIFAQTFTDWELVVCDSHSDDGAWEFFQTFQSDERVFLHRVPRQGLYAGWNECIRRARGSFIYFATSDDTMDAHCLEKLIQPLIRNPSIDLCVCDFEEIDENGAIIADQSHYWHRRFYGAWMNRSSIRSGLAEFLAASVLESTWVTMTTVLFRRRLLERTGLFPSSYGVRGDMYWTLKALLHSDVAYVPERLATFRRRPGQSSQGLPPLLPSKSLLTILGDLLDDPATPIPEDWSRVPMWRERLLAPRSAWLKHSLNLARHRIRREPLDFLRSLVSGIRHEPAYTLSQLFRGLPAPTEPDMIFEAHNLISTFQAPWPPMEMDFNGLTDEKPKNATG